MEHFGLGSERKWTRWSTRNLKQKRLIILQIVSMIVWRIWENMTSQLPEELVPRGMPSMRLCKACRMEMLVWQGINVGILTVSVKFIPLKFSVHSCRSLLFLSPPPLSLSLSLSPTLLSSATSHAKWRIGAAVYWGYKKNTEYVFSLLSLPKPSFLLSL